MLLLLLLLVPLISMLSLVTETLLVMDITESVDVFVVVVVDFIALNEVLSINRENEAPILSA